MSNNNYNSGKNDAQSNKGPKADNSHASSQAREQYNAGYAQGKKK